MREIFVILIIAVCFPSLALSQLHCHRCYGNSYCNNATDTDFQANIRNATCNVASPLDFETNDPYLQQLQKAINQNVLRQLDDNEMSPFNFSTQGHCLTATIHEPHDSHTLRTCVVRNVPTGNNVTLCELLNGLIQPMNWYNGTFTCRACNGTHFCNAHTLNIEDGIIADSSDSDMVSISFGVIIAALSLNKLLF